MTTVDKEQKINVMYKKNKQPWPKGFLYWFIPWRLLGQQYLYSNKWNSLSYNKYYKVLYDKGQRGNM